MAATVAVVLLAQNILLGESKIEQQVPRLYGSASPQFKRAMGALLGPPIVGGNRYQALLNGDQIFPPMLAAIRGAQHSISFETYIYWSGDIGREFADALAERARAGVKVHVLLDWLGSSKIDGEFLKQMKQAGVAVERFHAPHWYQLDRFNNRTHRKLLVVDGQIGFTGGVGIAPLWTGNGEDAEHWRDSHFQVEGPVVAQMQTVFMDNWMKASGQALHGDVYFPAIKPHASSADSASDTSGGQAQMFSSSPSGGGESMHLMYLLAIQAADRAIDLSSAYFVPDDLTQRALTAAVARGVRVRIITPGPVTDSQIVAKASRASWGALLAAGVQIFEYQPSMYHCKVLVVDDALVSVGSTNFDSRSFRLNDEANLNIYDAAFARAQTAVFERDLAQSKPVTFAQWQARPWTDKVMEQMAALFSAQL